MRFWLALAITLCCVARDASAVLPTRPVTVADLIALKRFAPGEYSWYEPERFAWSHDGARAAVLVYTGNLARNTRDYELLLFVSGASAHQPRVLTRFSSSSNRPAIKGPRWLSDNTTIAFLAENPGELPQIYTLHTASGSLVRRTHEKNRIRHFDISGRGDVVLYAVETARSPEADPRKRARGFVLPPEAYLLNLLEGDFDSPVMRPVDLWENSGIDPVRGRLELRLQHGDEESSPIVVPLDVSGCSALALTGAQLAPRAEAILIPCRPKTVPGYWNDYAAHVAPHGKPQDWRKWLFFDLESGATRDLIGTPIPFLPNVGMSPPVLWSGENRSVVVLDALLPLDAVSGQSRAERANRRYTVEVDLTNGAISTVTSHERPAPEPPFVIWQTNGPENLLRVDDADASRYFARSPTGWRRMDKPPAARAPRLIIEQGLNSPWKLAAVDPLTRSRRIVYDLNPGLLKQYRFARVTALHWTYDSGRKKSSGTLYWPPQYRAGRRYPLVIQGHGQSLTHFWPEGETLAREAAQPLANAGMFIAQISEGGLGWDQADFSTYRSSLFAQLEGLIDHLDQTGFIDRERVGMAGVSTGFGAFLHFMTHSDYKITAAALAEGVTYSYLSYLTSGVGHAWPGWQGYIERLNGGLPWGEGRQSWLARAPGFNPDRIDAAIQFESSGESLGHILGMWEIYQGMRLMKKPVELVFQPDATHVRLRPWDCFTSQQGTVDWLRFWLQGYERTQPVIAAGETVEELSEKFSRWRSMRTRRKLQEHS